LAEEYGDALQVIFVECQGATRDQFEAFVWKQKWMGPANAMWTEERPFQTLGNGLPETALLGIDGKILLQGYPGNFGKKLEEMLAAEIKKSKDAPAGTAAPLKKAWTSFAKGEIAAALAECDKLGTDEAKAAREEFAARTNARVARAKWLIENGFLVEAEKHLDRLAKDVKGAPELESLVNAEVTRMNDPALAAERDAGKAVSALFGQIAKKKPFDAPNVQKAESLAEKHAGTKSAERAARFAALSKVRVGG
jgi:hypothetical protein